MKKRFFAIFIMVILFVGYRHACTLQAAEINIPVREYTLKNGIRVLIVEKHDAPIFSAHILFKSGSMDDPVGLTGVAHMLEHMMFKGTKTLGTVNYKAEIPIMEKINKLDDEIDREKAKGIADPSVINWNKINALKKQIKALEEEQKKYVIPNEMDYIYEKNGGGSSNAYTSYDNTSYTVSLPSNRLQLWAYIESDRIKNPAFRMFSSERDVVAEERKQRTDASPDGKMFENFMSALYQSTPYHHSIIGWPADIESFKSKDVMEIFKRNYSPQNMVIAIVGDVNPEKAISIIQKYFGDIPNAEKVRTVFTTELPQKGQRRVQLKEDANPVIRIGFVGPKPLEKDKYVMDVISQIMSSGLTSRLYKQLVENKKLVTGIGLGSLDLKYGIGVFITANPVKGADLKTVEDEIFNELEKLKKEKVTQWELEKAKNNLISGFIRGLQDNEAMADVLASNEGIFGSWRYFDLRKKYEQVTADDIQKAAQKYFNKDSSTVAVMVKE